MARKLSVKETIKMFSNENGFAWGINTVMKALVPQASYDLTAVNETFVIDRWDSEYPQPTSKEIKEEYERQQKEKDRILRRIMDQNCRFMGMGFRQALQWTVAAREAEIRLMQRQRGIMNRMVDSNARLMSAGYNKLIEEWKNKQGQLNQN